MKLIKKNLRGLLIEGLLEPGHSLLDLPANMLQLNEMRNISPDKYVPSFESEDSPQTDRCGSWEFSDCGKVKGTRHDDYFSFAGAVDEALHRKGIALVSADLVQNDKYCRYLSFVWTSSPRTST